MGKEGHIHVTRVFGQRLACQIKSFMGHLESWYGIHVDCHVKSSMETYGEKTEFFLDGYLMGNNQKHFRFIFQLY